MRSGAAAGHTGYFHETAYYDSDEELLAIVLPFLRDGVTSGEPTLVTFAEHNAALVRAALPDSTGITFLPGATRYARPASAIREYREYLAEQVAGGAEQIRVVGDVPHPGTGAPWETWARYEAAVNFLYDEFPIWGMCPYDRRITPDHVLADVARTHPRIATADGRHTRNDRFEDPGSVLATLRWGRLWPDRAAPAVELADPTPPASRAAVRAAAVSTGLDREPVEDLVFAVSEAVTNALCHGTPPVLLRLWPEPDRLTATVTDHGRGPADPLVGLVPTTATVSAGLGLWAVHQLLRDVIMSAAGGTFTISMSVDQNAVRQPFAAG